MFITLLTFYCLSAAKEDAVVSECKRHCRDQTQFERFVGRKVYELCKTKCDRIQDNENPYVFHDGDFSTLFKTNVGELRLLQKFTVRSEMFKGIENIRMLVFEVDPLTFVVPSHWDSDILFFVSQGRGTISLVFEDRRESFNIETGHLMTIPAGITFYMINNDDHQTLVLSSFVRPIANPGNFASFFGVGGQDPESFFSAFSTEVLESAFNSSSEKLQRLFCQQKNGVIIKASKDQIKALTAAEDPTGSNYCLKDFGPCQILSYLRESTECGKLFMVDPTEYTKLQDFDMYISFCVTSQGCMSTPFYSTRVTKVIVVVNGRGRFEMASPGYEEGSSRIHYKKISSELSRGMVFVIPPGHPTVLMASPDENLETINFEFHAKGNEKFSLAGRTNLMKNFQKEAKELAFAISAEEVDEVLDSQQLDSFVRGPGRLQWQDTAFSKTKDSRESQKR
ncbi:hypothetical protein vseg_016993 [Gypsophila vaccaria]